MELPTVPELVWARHTLPVQVGVIASQSLQKLRL